MAFSWHLNTARSPPKHPGRNIPASDNNDMKKTQDKRPKPAEDPKATKHKGVPTIPKEIWEKALAETRRKEAKNAGPAVLWPAND
tara:strand:+ start:498 stop:752 length:255 start_codon:yes stop_codon:yes gene_type:complete